MPDDVVHVYVGGSRAEWLPTRVLEHSIRRRTTRPLVVRSLAHCQYPVPRKPENRQRTRFSFQRYCVPGERMNRGRAIYLDSDILVMGDIGELWDLLKEEPADTDPLVLTAGTNSAVMLLQTKFLHWEMTRIIQRLDREEISYGDLMSKLDKAGLVHEARWDRDLSWHWHLADNTHPDAKLIHFTNMFAQPWLRSAREIDQIWVQALRDAISDGFITLADVAVEVELSWVRPSLLYEVQNHSISPELKERDAEFEIPAARGLA